MIFILVLIPFFSITSSAAPGDEVLAAKYAPILYFEKEETHYPIDASYHIDNSILYAADSEIPIDTSPTAAELKSYTTDGFYLDIKDKTIDDGASAYTTTGYTTTVYFKVHASGTDTIIQYWMYYAFNNGELNQHEGDWEMVQVVLSNGNPSWVAYSQHHSGQWATWDQVEKDGNNIKVYVARGAHANYLRSYSGKLGIASDIVGDNGEVLKSGDYTLADLDDQDWLDFAGRWGEIGQGSAEEAASSSILGRAGPHGPQFREDGKMWDDPVAWGKSVPQANDLMFLAEWFFYNFVMIVIILAVITLALMCFFIYRRHKKYGLGPRIVSMLYIDGINLKSIGNILCIVGIIVAIIGLINPWYEVSYEFSGSGVESLDTSGWQEAIIIDGLNGIQIVVPTTNGPSPVGTLILPFSLLFGLSIIFLVIASIGVINSRKLGLKYIFKGIRFILPIILILIVIMSLGSIVPKDLGGDEVDGAEIDKVFSSISGSPIGDQSSYAFEYEEEGVPKTANLNMKWGIGFGGWLLLLAAIIMIVSGALEISAKAQFFQPKTPIEKPPKEKRKKPKKGKQQAQQPVPPPAAPASQKDETDASFCPECGAKLGKDAEFCPECGTKK
jgi:hypothetical protein